MESVLRDLAPPGIPIADAVGRVPATSGLYAIYGDIDAADDLHLTRAGAETLLYVGKAEDDLVARDVRTHFASGRTGSSTVRRSFAALLREPLSLRAMPRNPAKPGYFHCYGLEEGSDARLTEWMHVHLTLSVWPNPPGTSLREIERSVLNRLDPPLNIAAVATGRSDLQAARARMADEARAWTPS
jgi:hypothetical protein